MLLKIILLTLFFIATVTNANEYDYDTLTRSGYATVRQDAYMFWWLYHAQSLTPNGFVRKTDSDKYPLIIWLQGGPGASSTGFGNFEEIGPLDSNRNVRKDTWAQHANLLFIDNPVGTGFSYVTSDDAYATDNNIIGEDLVILLKHFFKSNPKLQNSPLYIFSESYGGKMAVSFTIHLWKAIQTNQIQCNFKGIALGDSWISPYDSVASWPSYLKAFSLVDEHEYNKLNRKVEYIHKLLEHKQFYDATQSWGDLENEILEYTFNVDFYNVLKRNYPTNMKSIFAKLSAGKKLCSNKTTEQMYLRRMEHYRTESLYTYMNTYIHNKLKIPSDVTWKESSSYVFGELASDFMRPVVDDVSFILQNLPIQVNVISGQLDLIVNVLGTEAWVNRLQFKDAEHYKQSQKKPLKISNGHIVGFQKSYGKLSFYWIFNAGHMIPSDQSAAGLKMLHSIINPN